MTEYIEREMAVRKICDNVSQFDTELDADYAVQLLFHLPPADVEEVVRCKNCIHWNNGDCYRLELSSPTDFCSYGKRSDV